MPSGLTKSLTLILLWSLAGCLAALVPPHPRYESIPRGFEPTRIEAPGFAAGTGSRAKTIPNDILVLRVQFSDVQFATEPAYPDSLVHDFAYFNRWMVHLGDLFSDASHGSYALDYHIHPDVLTLPQTMAYYGGDSADGDTTDVRAGEFAQAIVQQIDAAVNFSQYGGIIIFHAGPGQESDISRLNKGSLWSTFLTRRSLQFYLDPENDDYPGLPTNDGINLTNLVVVPESEYHSYFPGPQDDPYGYYLFSLYGVLAHQYGHILGLPTLYDNVSSNGASQGIGNWGLMGQGLWNGSGYTPAQLSAWCRMYLGWETPIEISGDAANLSVDQFLNHSEQATRLYKLEISDTEYFLVENRQQNPDGSLDPISNTPSYSFVLLPPGEQDYYLDNPSTNEDESLRPYFNFMENRYKGCEWDFMLPGLGGPAPDGQQTLADGSGLLIWHIDEAVIAQNFSPDFEANWVNSDASHKGVDLEEADGTQHLDSSAPGTYKYGSPFDSFRYDNNEYFGLGEHNGVLSLPTSESYYGGIPLEVHDISPSGIQMTFSARFGWSLAANYEGENPFNACLIDFDADGAKEIFYPMPDGQVYLWKNEFLAPGFPQQHQPLAKNYVWDGEDLYLPMQTESLLRLYRLGNTGNQYVLTENGKSWATQPLDAGEQLYLGLSDAQTGAGTIYTLDKASLDLVPLHYFNYPLAGNLGLFQGQLFALTREPDFYQAFQYFTETGLSVETATPVPADSTLVGVFQATLLPDGEEGQYIVQCLNSVYAFNADMEPLDGFPYVHDLRSTAPLTIADWDGNGSLDLILTSDHGLAVVDYTGNRMSPATLALAASDSLAFSSGAMASDLDNDGRKELIGSFGNNQLQAWEHNYREMRGFPQSFSNRSRNLPLIGPGSDGIVYAWVAADNGRVSRKDLPEMDMADLDGWYTEFGNLQRHASRDKAGLPNLYQSNDFFVDGEVYIYPNPQKSIYDQGINLNLMTNSDASLTVRIYDIGGSLVWQEKLAAKAYLRQRARLGVSDRKLASGVYIAVISADQDSRRIKFAVEK